MIVPLHFVMGEKHEVEISYIVNISLYSLLIHIALHLFTAYMLIKFDIVLTECLFTVFTLTPPTNMCLG